MPAPDFSITRRNFLIASCGFLLPSLSWAAIDVRPILHWPMTDVKSPGRELMTGSEAVIVDGRGRLEWVASGNGHLPRLDGYSIWFEHQFDIQPALKREITLSAWIALESFPVNTASIIEWNRKTSSVQFAVDRLGFLQISIEVNGQKLRCRSREPLHLGHWQHLVATLLPDGTLMLFVNGEEVSRAQHAPIVSDLGEISTVFMGRAVAGEVIADTFPSYVLNGLLREIRVYDKSLLQHDIEVLSHEFEGTQAPLGSDSSWFANDVQRPRYHAMPAKAWTNEPHGLVRFRGLYHLFFQKNANGPYWGHIHWGHLTSPDLQHWTEQDMALVPSPGPDAEGCWSGSVLVDSGKIVIFYTGGDGKRASICMASSEDGLHFIKHAANPVIQEPPTNINVQEFRDPFVWKEGTEYRMIIGSGIPDVGGTALLYKSEDLISWKYLGPLLIGSKENSGVFWEMPVFIEIGDYHVLIVCEVPGRASYWVGTWSNDEFHVISKEPHRLDLFNHFLSPTPYIDDKGRAIAIGIIPDSCDPKEAWQAGWAHLYGLPRELTLDAERQLQQRPIEELNSKFLPLASSVKKQVLSRKWTVLKESGACVRLKISLEEGSSESVIIALRRSSDGQEETLLRYNWRDSLLTLDRTKSSLNTHTRRDLQHATYVPRVSGKIDLDIFIDNSVIEVFVDLRNCFATRVYPVLPESLGMAVCADGGEAYLNDVSVSLSSGA